MKLTLAVLLLGCGGGYVSNVCRHPCTIVTSELPINCAVVDYNIDVALESFNKNLVPRATVCGMLKKTPIHIRKEAEQWDDMQGVYYTGEIWVARDMYSLGHEMIHMYEDLTGKGSLLDDHAGWDTDKRYTQIISDTTASYCSLDKPLTEKNSKCALLWP